MTNIHVARFGNRNSQHSVLAHSGVPPELLTPLIWRTDAPPDSSGLGLDRFVSAFRLSDIYVVQSTRADVGAPRHGMVITNAALVPVDFVGKLDLAALWFALDEETLSCDTQLSIDDFLRKAVESEAHVHAPGAGAIASALLCGEPVVWVGAGLVEAIGCVWLHLRQEDRARLVVGAAAHPARLSIATQPGSLLVIQSVQSVTSRWSGWTVVSASIAPEADAARDAMFGDDAGSSAQLAQDLELNKLGGNSWRHLAAATNLLDSVAELDHESCRALLQLLGLLQPDSQRGRAVKELALQRLRDITAQAQFGDIRGLRGLPWQAFGRGQQTSILKDWSASVTADSSRTVEVLDAIAATRGGHLGTFGEALASSLAVFINSTVVQRLAAASMHDERGIHVVSWLIEHQADVDEVDIAFAKVAELLTDPPVWLASVAANFRMRRLHAASVDVSDAVAAWRAHVQLKPRLVDADDILAKRTAPAGLVAAALAITDRKLTAMAAVAVLKNGKLLAEFSITDSRMREVWFEAVTLGADPWDSVEPAKAVEPLLDLLVAGQHLEEAVLESLSRTTAANLTDYEHRANVWDALPPTAINGFRSATAASLARSYQGTDAPPEPLLQTALLSSDLLAAIAQESPEQAIELVSGLPTARDSDAVVVIRNARFNPTTESAVAELVVKRRWRSAADTIIALSATRPDLQMAAQRVGAIYGPLEKLMRFFAGDSQLATNVTKYDLKAAVVDTVAELYADGPKSDRIWARAGGDEADLVSARTGRLAWGQAVAACQAGRRGAPSLSDLISEMIKDYPGSHELHALKRAIGNGYR